MKQLLAGIVLILAVGLGAFVYRNIVERPHVPVSETACTLEAKLCPDGTSVGRTGPSCAFAPCPFPNVEVAEKQVAFVAPEGYIADEQTYGADSSLIAAFQKPGTSGSNRIVVRSYPILEGQTADEVMLAHTRYEPSDMQATDFSKFGTTIAGGKTFRSTVIERFEGHVQSIYFFAREHDVLAFEVVEVDVTNWMDASLKIESLPEHQVLLSMLATLQAGN